VAEAGAVVPALWKLEVANGLQMALRRKRIDSAYRDAALGHLGRMPITVDVDTATHAWTGTLQLADRFGLTLYDAAYLELARRRALPLATLDAQLRDAGRSLGIALLGGAGDDA
jgi:predicted nucleic acid-binding protein